MDILYLACNHCMSYAILQLHTNVKCNLQELEMKRNGCLYVLHERYFNYVFASGGVTDLFGILY